MEELILVSILKLGPLNSFVSTFIEGVPKSTVYCIGLVNSSIILKDVFSVILLGNGSYFWFFVKIIVFSWINFIGFCNYFIIIID